MFTRRLLSLAALWVFAGTPAVGQTCSAGRNPDTEFPFFGNTDPNLGLPTSSVTIFPNAAAASSSALQSTTTSAAAAWNQSCPQSSYPNIPAFNTNWGAQAPPSSFAASHNDLEIDYLSTTPAAANANGTYTTALWTGGGSSSTTTPSVIQVYGLCPPKLSIPGLCTNGGPISWTGPTALAVLEHEIGHALGLDHDRTTDGSGNTCPTNGVMESSPSAGALILASYCMLANRENNDKDVCNDRKPTSNQTNPCESDPPPSSQGGGPGNLGLGSNKDWCVAYAWDCTMNSSPDWTQTCAYYCTTTTDSTGEIISSGCTWNCDSDEEEEANTDLAGPTLSVTSPSSDQTVSGIINLTGWAMQYFAPATITLGVDGNQVSIGNLVRGLPSPAACTAPAGVEHYLCNTNSGFTGTFDTRTLSNGSHTLDVLAGTSIGWSTSMEISLVTANTCFDMVPPTISLSAPAAGASVTGTVSVTAAAADNVAVGQVAFYVDGQIAKVVTAAPWVWSWDTSAYSPGTHILYAVATDTCNNSTGARTVAVNVVPTIRMYVDQPTSGSTVTGNAVYMLGWATDTAGIASITFTVDGMGSLPVTTPYTYGLNRPDVCAAYPGNPACPYVGWGVVFDSTQMANGAHTLRATATDHDGQTITFTLPIVVSNAMPPVVSMVWMAPAAAAGFGPAGSLVVAGDASGAPAGTGVQVYWRDVTAGGPWTLLSYTAPVTNGSWANSIANANDSHEYAAYATYGGSTSSTCTYPGSNATFWCP